MDENTHNAIATAIVLGGWLIGWLIWRAIKYPRHITDERGERQRVIAWNRGEPVYDPKTWRQRIQEEAIVKRRRRFTLLWSLPMLAGALYVIWWVGKWWILNGELMAVPFLLLIAFGWPALKSLFLELLYLSGYQGMQGAQVLDQKPGQPKGIEQVETQKAHGDAHVADEAEALALLNPKN